MLETLLKEFDDRSANFEIVFWDGRNLYFGEMRLVDDLDRNKTSISTNRREKLDKLVSSAGAFNALYALEQTQVYCARL